MVRQKEREREIIEYNEELSKLPEESKGTKNLIKRLIQIQRDKLLSSKFEIRDQIAHKLNDVNKHLKALPEPIVSIFEKMNVFKTCLRKFESDFKDHCDGSNVKKELNISTRLREKFEKYQYENFQKYNSKYFADEYYNEITEITHESKGLKLANFIHSPAFHLLIKKEIKDTKNNCFSLLEEVYSYILSILVQLCDKHFNLYPNLKNALISELKVIMMKQKEATEKLITTLLDVDLNVVFTISPYYLDLVKKVKEKIVLLKNQINQPTTQSTTSNLGGYFTSSSKKDILSKKKDYIDDIEIEVDDLQNGLIAKSKSELENVVSEIQISLFAYMKLFEKRFVDYYFNILLHNIVNYFYTDEFSNILDVKFAPNSNTEVANWIVENNEIGSKRKGLDKSKKTLDDALDQLNKIF